MSIPTPPTSNTVQLKNGELIAIQKQIQIILAIALISTCVCILIFLWSELRKRFFPSSSSSSSKLNSVWNASDDVDHQRVYLLAPTPGQRWTSHFSHVSPSTLAQPVDEKRLNELLTPSKDWWSGHKKGTPADLNEKDLAAMPKLDFDNANEQQKEVSASKRNSTRRSRNSKHEEEEVKQQDDSNQASLDDVDFAVGGAEEDDENHDESADSFGPGPTSSSSRKSATPLKHRRSWTHTIIDGIQEARIHRKGRQLF